MMSGKTLHSYRGTVIRDLTRWVYFCLHFKGFVNRFRFSMIWNPNFLLLSFLYHVLTAIAYPAGSLALCGAQISCGAAQERIFFFFSQDIFSLVHL